jgi:hypothetical protein
MSAGRPLEYIAIPIGGHNLVRVRQRYDSLTANVDWMDFWLQSHEDSDPAKTEKYARWRKMKARWELQQAWEKAGHPAGSRPARDFKLGGAAKAN